MLTNGNFTREEWNHLLRLFSIMNFSMFSCSHFLSIKKPNTIVEESSRNQGQWVWYQETWAQNEPSLDSGASCNLVNQGLGRTSVFTSAERSVRDSVKNPTVCSEEWQRDDNPFSSAGGTTAGDGRLVRGIQIQLARTKLAYHNLQISDSLYLEKVFTNVRQKLPSRRPDSARSKSQCIDMVIIYVNNDESSDTSGRRWHWKFG